MVEIWIGGMLRIVEIFGFLLDGSISFFLGLDETLALVLDFLSL